MKKKIKATIVAIMAALALVPAPALAYIGNQVMPDESLSERFTLEYWRSRPRVTRNGVTYFIDSDRHAAMVWRVKGAKATIPQRFKVGKTVYYPVIIWRNAISYGTKKLVVHGHMQLLDETALFWCKVKTSSWQDYKSWKKVKWAKSVKHFRCDDCKRHEQDKIKKGVYV